MNKTLCLGPTQAGSSINILTSSWKNGYADNGIQVKVKIDKVQFTVFWEDRYDCL